MHLQHDFLPKGYDFDKHKIDTNWEKIREVFSNESIIKVAFIRELLKAIDDKDKISIFIGEELVVGNPDFEIAKSKREINMAIFDDLEEKGFIVNRRITTKSIEQRQEDDIYVNFETTKKDIEKYLKSLLREIEKKNVELEKISKKKRSIKYELKLIGQNIFINETVIGKTAYYSSNAIFIEYAYSHSGKRVLLSELRTETDFHLAPSKQLKNIVSELGFKGELKKIFFPGVTKTSFIFNKTVSKYDLEEKNINIKKLDAQIKSLKRKS